MNKVTLYGSGSKATYEELGAIELLKGCGASVDVVLPEKTSEVELHSARLVLSAFGVDVAAYTPGEFERRGFVVSFGRPDIFSIIRAHADRPHKLVYGFHGSSFSKDELKANSEGMIDEVFVKSKGLGVELVKAFVKKSNRGVEFRAGYTPFCNPSSDYFQIEFQKKKPSECFYFMRNTPDAPGFSFPDHWRMVSQVTCPHPKVKHFVALNWGKQLSKVAGNPGVPSSMWHTLINTTIESFEVSWSLEKDAYYKSSALVHFYPEEESFSFAAAKAMLSGVVVVAGPAPAFLELLEHEVSGFFAKTSEEAAYYTSRLAWEPFLRMKLATEARAWFVSKGPGNADNCLPWWKGLLDG